MNIHWLQMLTLDHTYCRVCFQAGRRDDGGRIAGAAVLRDTQMRKTLAGVRSRQRAAVRRHFQAEHPDWVARVQWAYSSSPL